MPIDDYLIFDLKRVPHCISEIAAWHQEEWAHLNPGESLAQRIQRMQGYLSDADIPTMLVAVDSHGNPLGTAMLDCSDMSTRMELSPWLASVYVREEQRKRGIAEHLLEAIHRLFLQTGLERYYLYTPDQAAYYAKRGWHKLERCVYQGEDVTLMCRTI